MLDNCCAFTGHRPYKLPWRYNEADSRCLALKAALAGQITQLVDAGVTDFYRGRLLGLVDRPGAEKKESCTETPSDPAP